MTTINNRLIQALYDKANAADYDFMRWSDFFEVIQELRNPDTTDYSGNPDPSGSGGPIPINDLLAADGTNTINNANYNQHWQWNSLTGTALQLSSTSTAADENKLISASTTGANASSSKSNYGFYSVIGNTGSFSTNYGGYFKAQSGTFNFGLYAEGSTNGLQAHGSGAGANGVSAFTSGTSGSNKAVNALSNGSGATENAAFYGEASGATTNYGAYLTATGGTNNHALITLNGNVGFGIATPNSKSLLEMSSTTQGFLPPRMTTTQMNAISSPPEGLTIYNTTEKTLAFYDGTNWQLVQVQV